MAHIAGTHLHNIGRDESNIVTARRVLPDANLLVLAFSSFEEGLMIAPATRTTSAMWPTSHEMMWGS